VTKRIVSQGTISVLCGSHSVVHSVLVMRAWRRLYGKWPKPWECVCILLHDVGHIGKNYLDDVEQKNQHWILGATMAKWLFGEKGYLLTAGHCKPSGVPESELYKADKYSWYIAPTWWLWLNTVAEPSLRMGYTRMEAIRVFRAQVKQSVESGVFAETHSFFLDRCKPGQSR
jgi:hypothetical protein